MAATERVTFTRVICKRDALLDGGVATRFTTPLFEPLRDTACFVVAYDGDVYAYVNSCPHRGTELDWQPGEVFEETGLYLMCATHGALFEPDNGLCIAGPCHGARLQSVAIKVVGNDVVLVDSAEKNTNEKF